MINRRIITIPPGFMRNIEVNWDIDWRGQSPRAKVNGATEDVLSAYPLWVGTPTISLRREHILAWRAIRAQAQGRANLYRIRMCDPLGSHLTGAAQSGVPFSDDQPFASGLGFENRPFMTAVSGVSRGSETMVVSGTPPRQGQIISHNDWPYLVTSVLAVSGGDHRITFQMPLYAAIPAGDPVYLDGSSLFEAADADMGAAPYGPGFHTTARLSFRQYINR